MPSTLIRLAVALFTFGLGVSATMFWVAYRTPEAKLYLRGTFHTRFAHHTPPLPMLPPPPPPLAELLPPPPPPSTLAPVYDGHLNDRALSKPAPVYPQAAVAANVSGMVRVRVLADKDGRVISAKAISGHPLLREAAVQAAYQAHLVPWTLGGEAVKFSGTLSYDFVLP